MAIIRLLYEVYIITMFHGTKIKTNVIMNLGETLKNGPVMG